MVFCADFSAACMAAVAFSTNLFGSVGGPRVVFAGFWAACAAAVAFPCGLFGNVCGCHGFCDNFGSVHCRFGALADFWAALTAALVIGQRLLPFWATVRTSRQRLRPLCRIFCGLSGSVYCRCGDVQTFWQRVAAAMAFCGLFCSVSARWGVFCGLFGSVRGRYVAFAKLPAAFCGRCAFLPTFRERFGGGVTLSGALPLWRT